MTSPRSSLCPHWALSTSVLEGPSPCSLVMSFIVRAFEKDEKSFTDSCGHSYAARGKQASQKQGPHTAEV